MRHACIPRALGSGAKSVTTAKQGIGAKSVMASGSNAKANTQKEVETSFHSTLARQGKNTATTASG